MTALRSLFFVLLFYLWCAILGIAYLPLFLMPHRWIVAGGRFWADSTLFLLKWIAGLTYEVRGRENIPGDRVIYALKHQSAWDTVIVASLLRDPAIVLKRELTWIPFYGWYLRRTRMLAVDRKSGGKALKRLIAEAQERVAEGRDIAIFPEGTRTEPGERAPYRPGIAALYKALNIPVVPVALNSGYFWARRSFIRRPGTIVVEFLPAVQPGLARKAFMTELHQRIDDACERLNADATDVGGTSLAGPTPTSASTVDSPVDTAVRRPHETRGSRG